MAAAPAVVSDTAMGDLLGEDLGLVQIDKLYRCLDKLLEHKTALFSLRQRWQDLFQVRFEVLLYDLTSTYFECDPPRREAAIWLQPGQTVRLRAGGDCLGRHAGGIAAGL